MYLYVFCIQSDIPTDQVSYILNAHWYGKSLQKIISRLLKKITEEIIVSAYWLEQSFKKSAVYLKWQLRKSCFTLNVTAGHTVRTEFGIIV